jgi:hypothetical protein
MPDLTAKRTLVKSPPELWEELSEVDRLAKHLAAFGEITITKLEPEHTVAWEGEHASGTVSIEPSGWGTKVTLRAELPEAAAGEPEPEPVSAEAVATPDEPEPAAAPDEPGPAAVTEESWAIVEEPEAVEQTRGRFWKRLFGRRRPELVAPDPEPVAEAPPVEAPPVEEPPVEEPPVEEPPDEEPPDEKPPVGEPGDGPDPAEGPDPVAETLHSEDGAALDTDRARVILDEALDTLGAAHHRPFSRG